MSNRKSHRRNRQFKRWERRWPQRYRRSPYISAKSTDAVDRMFEERAQRRADSVTCTVDKYTLDR